MQNISYFGKMLIHLMGYSMFAICNVGAQQLVEFRVEKSVVPDRVKNLAFCF